MADKSARNLLDAIHACRKRDFWRVIFALGIRHVGARSAQILEDHFEDMNALKDATTDDLEQVPDIGPIVAQSIVDFFAEERIRGIIGRLAEAGLQCKRVRSAEATATPLTGRTFVLTGALSGMTRDQAGEAIRALGGTVTSSVSRKTTYLVCGADPGAKLKTAENFNVKILDEQRFTEFIEGHAKKGISAGSTGSDREF